MEVWCNQAPMGCKVLEWERMTKAERRAHEKVLEQFTKNPGKPVYSPSVSSGDEASDVEMKEGEVANAASGSGEGRS